MTQEVSLSRSTVNFFNGWGSQTEDLYPSTPKIEPYDGLKWANVPGLASLIYTPIDLFHASEAWIKAEEIGDEEAKEDLKVRFAGMPLALCYGVLSLFTTLSQVGTFLKIPMDLLPPSVLALLGLPATFLGVGVCAVEAVFESIGICRQVDLLDGLHHSTDPEKQIEDLQKIQKRFLSSLTEAEAVKKKTDLARRVHPWLAEEIERDLKPLLEGLHHADSAVRKAAQKKTEELLDNLDIQAKKKLLIHIVGLTALILSAIGLIAGLAACPFLAVAVLLGIGSLLAMGRWFLVKGLFSTRGWTFSAVNCLPECLVKKGNLQ